MDKSHQALVWTLESLPGSGWVYHWTLTFPDVVEIPEALARWRALLRDLNRIGLVAVRVFELHPGGHGLHVHLVTPFRYDVDKLRPVCESHGFGRINAKRRSRKAITYVAKYAAKSKRPGAFAGVRLWARIGWKHGATLVSSVRLACPESDAMRTLMATGVCYRDACVAVSAAYWGWLTCASSVTLAAAALLFLHGRREGY